METPSSQHEHSEREYIEGKVYYDYAIDFKQMKVTKSGAARWGAYYWVFISSAAIGRYVAAEEIGNGIWKVYYRNVLLGSFDEKQFVKKQGYQKLTRAKV